MSYISKRLHERTDNCMGEGRDGKWWPMIPVGETHPRSVIFYCPDCGNPMSLGNHEIDATGKVIPSVVCPSNVGLKHGISRYGEKCQFHDFVILEGWMK